MKYFFIPGRLIQLSVAELDSVLKTILINEKYELRNVSNRALIVTTNASPESMMRVFSRLGGSIRFGEIIEDLEGFLEQYYAMGSITFGPELPRKKLR